MDFQEFKRNSTEQINQELKYLLDRWRREVRQIDNNLLPLVDQFIASCQGGKRLRGVLVVLGYELGISNFKYQMSNGKNIFKIAAAYEIFHTAILAHDDIMDESLLRRDQPSLYQALGGNHYGISQAINLGDAGFFLGIKTILETKFDGRLKLKAVEWFNQTMLETTAGQMLDIAKQDPLTTAKLKTARYSMAGPLVLGAILGGGYHLEGVKAHLPGELDSLAKFGENLGIAFQIKDDILDCEVNIWGGPDAAKRKAVEYKDQAVKLIPKITKDRKMGKILIQLAEYLVRRDK